jgi:hypothetical protein
VIKAGQIYSITLRQIVPPYEPSGYYGVCRVVRVEEKGAVVAALDWGGTAVPRLEQVVNCSVLQHGKGPFEGEPAIYWGAKGPIDGVEYLGQSSPSAAEIELTTCRCVGRTCTCRRFVGGWQALCASLNREWRKRVDPEGYAADCEWLAGIVKEHRRQAEAQHKAELEPKGLENFHQETLFQGWEGYHAPEIVRQSRELFQVSLDKLAELGEKASRTEKEKVLKECIEGFNQLNCQYDNFISTLEREAICHEFDRLTLIAGIQEQELADRWREW